MMSHRWQPALSPLLLSAAAALVGVYLAELYALHFIRADADRVSEKRIADRDWIEQCQSSAARYGYTIDPRSRLEALTAMRREGKDAFPGQHPASVLDWAPEIAQRIVPLGGIAHAWTQLCNEVCENVAYQNDHRGFRNPPDAWTSRPAQIAAVGDSFAQGICVRDGLGVVDRLRNEFPATLNFANGGNGPLLELAAVREYLPEIRPRVVLWFYYEGNDLTSIPTEARWPLLRSYLSPTYPGQGLAERQAEIDASWRGFLEARLKGIIGAEEPAPAVAQPARAFSDAGHVVDVMLLRNLRHLLGVRFGRVQEPSLATTLESGVPREGVAAFEEILRVAVSTVESWGGTLYLIYLPEYWRYDLKAIARQSPAWERSRVIVAAERVGARTVDVAAAFERYPNPRQRFWAGAFGHYNQDGYQVVADLILARLASDSIFTGPTDRR
jgi:hypothetical protein